MQYPLEIKSLWCQNRQRRTEDFAEKPYEDYLTVYFEDEEKLLIMYFLSIIWREYLFDKCECACVFSLVCLCVYYWGV